MDFSRFFVSLLLIVSIASSTIPSQGIVVNVALPSMHRASGPIIPTTVDIRTLPTLHPVKSVEPDQPIYSTHQLYQSHVAPVKNSQEHTTSYHNSPAHHHQSSLSLNHSEVNRSLETSSNVQARDVPSMYPKDDHTQSPVVYNNVNIPPKYLPGHPMADRPRVYKGDAMAQHFVPGRCIIELPDYQPKPNDHCIRQGVEDSADSRVPDVEGNKTFSEQPNIHNNRDPLSQHVSAIETADSSSTIANTVIRNQENDNENSNDASLEGQIDQPIMTPASLVSHPAEKTKTDGNSPNATVGTSDSRIPENSGIPTTDVIQNSEKNRTVNVSGDSRDPDTVDSHQNENLSKTDTSTNSGPSMPVDKQTPTTEKTPEFQWFISNEELWNLTESLFLKNEINASQYVEMNVHLQSDGSIATNETRGPIMNVQSEAYDIPTIKILRKIFDNYEFDSEKKEIMDSDKRRVESLLLDTFLNTTVMTTTMNWLSEKGYVEPNRFEWKDTLRRIWMSRVNGTTSGFERIFLAEKYSSWNVAGGRNWIYLNHQDSLNRINYFNIIDEVDLGGRAKLAMIGYNIDDISISNTMMLIGALPELEMALFTICYYVRPNDLCTASFGGIKFEAYTHSFRYFSKDLIDHGLILDYHPSGFE